MPKPRPNVSTRKAPRKTGTRKGKYNASGRHVNGIWCASKAEADRFEQLLRMAEAGVIEDLETQPPFKITVNGKHICTYKADFRYRAYRPELRAYDVLIEDVKGMILDVYLLKKKLVEAQYGVSIVEIPGRKVPEWEGRTP